MSRALLRGLFIAALRLNARENHAFFRMHAQVQAPARDAVYVSREIDGERPLGGDDTIDTAESGKL